MKPKTQEEREIIKYFVLTLTRLKVISAHEYVRICVMLYSVI